MRKTQWFFLALFFFFAESLFLFFLARTGKGKEVIVGDAAEIYRYLLEFLQGEPIPPRPFPFGSVLLWLPFYIIASLFASFFQALGLPVSKDSFSLFHQLLVAAGSSLYGFLALLLLYQLLKSYTEKTHALALTFFSLTATPLLYYLFFEPCMSHVPAFFVSLLFLHKLKQENKTSLDFFILGAILGLLALVRTLDSLYGLLLIPLFKEKKKAFPGLFFLATGFSLFFAFQLFLWKVQFDKLFVQPYGEGFVNYFKPKLFSFFFSTNHGLFLWHPYFLLCFLGLFSRRSPFFPFPLLALFSQAYINSAARDWFGGDAFGQRRMLSRLPLFSFGLVNFPQPHRKKLYWILGALTLWNFLFLVQWKLGLIPHQGTLSWRQFFLEKFTLFFR